MEIGGTVGNVPLAVGVDAWHKGWIGIGLSNGRYSAAWSSPTLRGIVEAAPGAAVFGVDIPIGLPTHPPRDADTSARAFVGERRASVFSALPAAVVSTGDYQEALTIHRELFGKGISRQAYALRDRIVEADRLARTDWRIIEVHPEVSFAAMATTTLGWPKRTWNGLQLRDSLLRDAGIDLPRRIDVGAPVPPEDILDAAAAAWSAARYARGAAESLPETPPLQDGRPVAIWY